MDLGPTTQELAVNELFKKQLAGLRVRFQGLRDKDTPAFNGLLKQSHREIQVQP